MCCPDERVAEARELVNASFFNVFLDNVFVEVLNELLDN
jgi:hypothetical protein